QATREELLAYSGWLLEHGDADRALHFAEQALTELPGDPEARVARAGALGVLGRADEAERELHDILSGGHNAASTHLALARLYLVQERLPDAIFHATEGARLDPDDPDFAVIHGLAAMQRGEMDEARAAFERERDLRPESAKAWLNLGRLELDTNHPEAAAACFRQAQALDPAGWFASYQLGLALQQAGKPREAADAYRQVLTRNERVAEAHNNLAWLLADLEMDPVLGEVHARRAAELAPGNAHVLGTLGWAQYKNRLFDEAAVSLKEARRLAPDDPMKHYMLGVLLADRGESAEASHALEEALRLDPRFGRSESARRILAQME
ncbi:MAG: tetratricopeptide repeat protein, partial [Gemmatimonadetes bacterium]|nr:tetratricopeptide repeat protein [Gemmatimonadota bacterium]